MSVIFETFTFAKWQTQEIQEKVQQVEMWQLRVKPFERLSEGNYVELSTAWSVDMNTSVKSVIVPELHKTGEEPDYNFIREDELLAISHCSLIKTSYHRLTSKERTHITMSHSFELCWTYNSKNQKNSESAATSQYKEQKHHRMAPGHSCRLRKLYILYLWHWKHKYKTN